MPRPSEIQAEEAAPPRSPLRRSCRIVAVSSSAPSDVKPVRGRKLSTTSNDGIDEEANGETKTVRTTRAASITKENSNPKPEPAKTRSRRSSATTEPPTQEEKKPATRGRRPSVTTEEPEIEVAKPVKGRRPSVTKEEEKKPVRGRRSSIQEDKNEDVAVKPVKGRRGSIQEDKNEDVVVKPVKGRRGSIQEDKNEDIVVKPIKGRRNSAQEDLEELPQRSTRSRRSASRDLSEDPEQIKTTKKIETEKEEVTERRRSRRASVESIDEKEDEKPVVRTPSKPKRRLSITENTLSLEPINEKEHEDESPIKKEVTVTPIKKKPDPIQVKANLDLSVISESSFTEETEANTSTRSENEELIVLLNKSLGKLEADAPSSSEKVKIPSIFSPVVLLNRPLENLETERKTPDLASKLSSKGEPVVLLTKSLEKLEENRKTPDSASKLSPKGEPVVLLTKSLEKLEEGRKTPDSASKLCPKGEPVVLLTKSLEKLEEGRKTPDSASKLSPKGESVVLLTKSLEKLEESRKTPDSASKLSPKGEPVVLLNKSLDKLEEGKKTPDSPARRSPRLLEKCKLGDKHVHKKCNCEDSSTDIIKNKKINFDETENSEDIDDAKKSSTKSPNKEIKKEQEKKTDGSNETEIKLVDASVEVQNLDDTVFLTGTTAGTQITETKTHVSDGSDGSFQFHLSKSKCESTEEETELNDSKTSESSEKENIAQNTEVIDKAITLQKTPLVKKVLEDFKDFGNKEIQNVTVSTARVSNVFRPKDVDHSFMEPMDVDITIDTTKLDKSHFNNTKTLNESIDETFSLCLNETTVETPKEKKFSEENTLEERSMEDEKKIELHPNNSNESKEQENASENLPENNVSILKTDLDKEDNSIVEIEDSLEKSIQQEENTLLTFDKPRPDVKSLDQSPKTATKIDKENITNVKSPTKETSPKISVTENEEDSEDEDCIFEENEPKDISDDYEFDILSEEEAEKGNELKDKDIEPVKEILTEKILNTTEEKLIGDPTEDKNNTKPNVEISKEAEEKLIEDATEDKNEEIYIEINKEAEEKLIEDATKDKNKEIDIEINKEAEEKLIEDATEDKNKEIDIEINKEVEEKLIKDANEDKNKEIDIEICKTAEDIPLNSFEDTDKKEEHAEDTENLNNHFNEMENSFKDVVKEDEDSNSVNEEIEIEETENTKHNVSPQLESTDKLATSKENTKRSNKTLEEVMGRDNTRTSSPNKKAKRKSKNAVEVSKENEEDIISPKMATKEFEKNKEREELNLSNTKSKKEKRFSFNEWFEEDIAKETNNTKVITKSKNKKIETTIDLNDSVFEADDQKNTITVEDLNVLQNKGKKKNPNTSSELTEENTKTNLTSRPSLEEFANARLDEYLAKKLDDFEAEENEDDYTDEESDNSNSFIDDMAEEGEEDTPSEDSNAIIDEGESIKSDSERSEDDAEDDDSFVCDEENFELLSGEEYDLGDSKKKKSRIISVEGRNEDVIKIERKPKPEPKKKKSRIIKVNDDSSSDEEIINLYSTSDDEIVNLDSTKPEIKSNSRITKVDDDSSSDEEIINLDSTKPEIKSNESIEKSNRRSSINIIENIDVKNIKDAALSDRINQLVDTFCTTIPDTMGGISMNLSLEFAGRPSVEGETNSKKKRRSKKKNRSLSDKGDPNVSTASIEETEMSRKTKEAVKRKSTEEEFVPPKEPRLSVSLEENSNNTKLEKRKLSRSMDDIQGETKKRKQNKSKKSKQKKEGSNVELNISAEELRKQTYGIMNQLLNDVKNRPKRSIKPSTTKLEDLNNCWLVEDVVQITPSTTIVSENELKEFKKKKIHPKDFRTQMLYDSSRVKRVETKQLLKKKGAYY